MNNSAKTSVSDDAYCAIIHGGMTIDLQSPSGNETRIGHCCLRGQITETSDRDIWHSAVMKPLRELNNQNIWDQHCLGCRNIEHAGHESFRISSEKMFGRQKNLPGPLRLDLRFGNSCNLACRTCTPEFSTLWQQQIKQHNLATNIVMTQQPQVDRMISILKTLDLSQLQMVAFAGGEPLLGNDYWRVVTALSELVDPKQVTLIFQTNGTQSIPQKYFELIEKFHLMKLSFSLDGMGSQFEYLRWPASWSQVTDNMQYLKQHLPSNVMFLIEETISVFNLWYQDELSTWARENFATNREGDPVNHCRHLATGPYAIANITEEYFQQLAPDAQQLIPEDWQENPGEIAAMIKEIDLIDQTRQQNWRAVFPEVAAFYTRFDTK